MVLHHPSQSQLLMLLLLLLDDAIVHCLCNYPARYTSHRLYSYKVHLPPFLYINHQSEAVAKPSDTVDK